ncbi:DUF4136 domain-containing protein [Polaribacter litorisediminis]|uniref:DUF4136 domain-containing protein n=1 Tax=Polaribacter litorisediminis TaxID=1908341 RepID=UPI001CBFB0C2|nr:DUF4136 domain-containing protein [Polaribacter litorisediminis]UAM96843.1 DUF4136 domain-containing protein [Polaribacter litorisediminis]
MKKITLFLFGTILMMSCSGIKVATDYDSKVDFSQYKTFAFYRPGIDRADISDLDKKRVLRAIEFELVAQGFVKSDDPDLLISIFTKSRRKVNVQQNSNWGYGFGWGFNPWMGSMNNINVNEYTEGTLFIDFIDKEKKELVWQGIGTGALKIENRDKKEERIKLFVKEIISRFPPDRKR